MLESCNNTVNEELAIASLSNYKPPQTTKPGQIWPPSVACKSWNNETPPDAIHYSQREIKEILRVVYEQGVQDGELLLSNYKNGLPSLLWGNVFSKVVSIYQEPLDRGQIVDSKQTILSGTLGDTRFLYSVMEYLSNLKAILIDEVYYAHIISPYFLFRKLIKPPGIIIFMNAGNKVSEHAGVHRFLNDLSSGFLDNKKHNIVHINSDPRGFGIGYEII